MPLDRRRPICSRASARSTRARTSRSRRCSRPRSLLPPALAALAYRARVRARMDPDARLLVHRALQRGELRRPGARRAARSSTRSRPAGRGSWTLGALAAIATFLVVQYAVLATMLRLARGVAVRDTVRIDCVLIDAGLLSLGALAAALGEQHWSLVALLLLPLALDYRVARDPEPGRSVADRAEDRPLQRPAPDRRARAGAPAGRALRPAALAAHDRRRPPPPDQRTRSATSPATRLSGWSPMSLRSLTRDYDVAARFGGDEFCVLLPRDGRGGALTRRRADPRGRREGRATAQGSADGLGRRGRRPARARPPRS